MARIVDQVRLPCKRGGTLHDACVLTEIISRRTGRKMKMPVDLVDDEGAVVGTSMEEVDERVITKLIRCTCECHHVKPKR